MNRLVSNFRQHLSLRLGLMIVLVVTVAFSLLFGYLFFRLCNLFDESCFTPVPGSGAGRQACKKADRLQKKTAGDPSAGSSAV